MGLSASLFLKQTQSLVMTPQLMQSIQLLQMTHLELTQFIAQEIEKNPLLELSTGEGEANGEAELDGPSSPDGNGRQDEYGLPPEPHWFESSSSITAERLSEGLDAGYDNVFPDDGPAPRADAPELLSQWKSMPGGESGDDYDLDDFVAGQVTLREHLNRQLPFLLDGNADRLIAQHLIDHLDEAGYMQEDLGEIAVRLGTDRRDVEDVLFKLQTLEPTGVFARSLSECLALQLRQKDRLDPAMEAFVQNLDLLAKRDFASLRRICGVDDEDLIDMLAEIRSLDPKPGAGFEKGVCETVIPDVIVRAASDGSWMVELNPDTLPRVLVNHAYYQRVSGTCRKSSHDHNFLSECLQNASWLTRSLDQRAKTIIKVATEIVRQQDGFLMNGVDHLRPLNLKTVAEAIKMHESTVSRVTSNKYMLTPRGMFELKYFFTVSIGSAEEGGDSHSAEAVRHRIRQLIAQETPDAVLSDDDIVISLKRGGVELARRTVAKYREAMNIPSSVQRRREKRALAKIAAF